MRRLPIPPNVLAAALRLHRRMEQAELGLISAGVAFFGFLAIFPGVAAVIAIWGVLNDPSVIRTQIEVLRDFLPPDAHSLIVAQIEALLAVPGGNLGWATLLSTAFALWSARAGVAALIRGLNAVHALPNRNGHWHQLRAMVLTFVLIGLALAAMVLAVVVPLAMAFLPLGTFEARVLEETNLGLGLLLMVLAVVLAYRYGPNYGANRPPLLSWGLLVAVVLWAVAARGFMLYLANFPAYNQVYGSIGAVAALMMWLYVSAYAVLLGAAVDSMRARKPRQ